MTDERVTAPGEESPSAETATHGAVFPAGDPRDGHILRLAEVQTWESQFLGIGRTVRVLTDTVLHRDHAADDLGLSLVYLQRHLVEVGLKLMAERTGGMVMGTHKLSRLRDAAQKQCRTSGLSSEWQTFDADQRGYITLMESADAGSSTFRYPTNTSGDPWDRAALVDVAALAEAGRRFERAVLRVVHDAERLEPLPDVDDAAAAVDGLATLSMVCRTSAVRSAAMLEAFRDERRRFGGRVKAEDDQGDAMVASRAVAQVTVALADRADRMVERLSARHGVVPRVEPLPAPAPMPPVDLALGATDLRRRRDAQITWVVDSVVAWSRPMIEAVRSVEALTADWATPAARQLHLDVVRFRSRLSAASPNGNTVPD